MKSKKMKPQGRRINPAKRCIRVKGKWKSIELDPSLFSEEGLEGLVCFEELTDYRLVDSEKAAASAAKELKKEQKKQAQKRKAPDVETVALETSEASGETAETPKKKAKKKKKKIKKINDDSAESVALTEDKEEAKSEPVEDSLASSQQDSEAKPTKKNKKKKKLGKNEQASLIESITEEQPAQESTLEDQPVELDEAPKSKPTKPAKEQIKNWTSAALSGCDDTNSDMSAWKDLYVPAPVLKALSSLGFSSPTPIQALALPSAIRDRMDILGAAETGSGKTLAFAIPIIHTILEWRENHDSANTKGDSNKVESLYLPDEPRDAAQEALDGHDLEEENADMEDSDVDEVIRDLNDGGSDEDGANDIKLGCVQIGEQAPFDPALLEESQDDERQNQPLLSLVLTPTRELAVQVKHHIDAVAKFTSK